MPATAARWGRAPASRRAAIRTSAGVRTLTTTAWARAALDDHRGGQAVVRQGGSPPASGPVGLRPGFRRLVPPPARESRSRRGAEPVRQPVKGARPRGRSGPACGVRSRPRRSPHATERRRPTAPRRGFTAALVRPAGRRLADPRLKRRAVPLQPLGKCPRVDAHGEPRPPAHGIRAADALPHPFRRACSCAVSLPPPGYS